MAPPPSAGGGFLNQGFTIAGHKISWAAVGAVAAAVGVVAVLRAKSSGSSVVSAGSAAAASPSYTVPTLDTGYSSNAYVTPDYNAQLDNLSSQLASLQQGSASAANNAQTVTLAGAKNSSNPGVYQSSVLAFTSPAATGGFLLPFGTYQTTGAPITTVASGAGGLYPIQGPGGTTVYALGENVESIQQGGSTA